ncbi:MAG: hypothetical protein SGCHY_004442 [Lobulomycetales sp.]
MSSTRLPLPLLRTYLPDFLYDQHDEPMFNEKWHIAFNTVWLIQNCIAILGCMFTGRWIMQETKSSNLLVRQFYVLLVAHTVFYVAEILISAVSILYFNMLVHHIVALLIFAEIWFTKHTVSVLLLLPFFMHSLFWTYNVYDVEFLAFYNWIFLYVGASTAWLSVKTSGRAISWRLSFLCLLEVAVNYYTYCTDFYGHYCYGKVLFTAMPRYKGDAVVAGTLLALATLASFYGSVVVNRRLALRETADSKKKTS